MARNGSGVYTKVNTFVSGNTITAAGPNQNWDDIAAEMTNSVAADGQTTITAPLKGANGSQSAPSYSFASDLTSGFWRIGAGNIGIGVSNTKILDISSTGVTITGALIATTLTGGISGLNIIGAPQLTAPANNDTLPIYDLSATTNSRILLSDFFKVINDFTADASPDNAADYVVTYDASATGPKKVLLSNLPAIMPRGYIDGLTLSQNSTTSLAIAAGKCRDSADSVNMTLSAFTKTTASWAAATGNGGLDTGSIASGTWYYAFVIQKSSDGTTDALFSASSSAPTMPSGYDKKRYIGAFKTDGSSHVPVINQKGGYFYYPAMISDIPSFTPADTNGHIVALTVPTGFSVRAIVAGGSANQILIGLTEPATTDTAISNVFFTIACGASGGGGINEVWTDTSGRIRYRISISGTLFVNTLGYFDPRGTNA